MWLLRLTVANGVDGNRWHKNERKVRREKKKGDRQREIVSTQIVDNEWCW